MTDLLPRFLPPVALTFALAACGRSPAQPVLEAPPALAGSMACGTCHAAEYAEWQISDHHEAMQIANQSTVQGDFDGARFTYNGVTSTFTRQNDRFVVRTDGPDGALTDFAVAFTFGRRPLQQYLIQMPRGRYQALGLAWDARPKAEGGEQWFHLYPDEKVDHRDVLHWTRFSQNWNFTCAECHSTDVRKQYRPERDVYETTFAEVNVSCESCHGPASRHVSWAALDEAARSRNVSKGLVFSMKDVSGGTWVVPEGKFIAGRTKPISSRNEVATCARCHARRAQIWPDYQFGKPIDDTHRVSLLTSDLYEDNGQQKDEVFEYGSFLQSRMFAAGVTCSDCHKPHSGALKFDGNALCTQCHVSARYDAPSHHRHAPRSVGAACQSCHMPERTYMVVDGRRDHAFSVPRPDESVRYGAPNACTDCHRDRDSAWAAKAVSSWFGPDAAARRSYTAAMHAARVGWPEAGALLDRVLADDQAPAITRATALSLLDAASTPGFVSIVERAARDPDPLMRRSAAAAAANLDQASASRIAGRLLDDEVRTVRLEAVSSIAQAGGLPLAAALGGRFDRVAAELRASFVFNADRAETRVTQGAFEASLGRVAEAETEYRAAIRMQPEFAPAYVNLADLLRSTGRETDAEAALREALARVPAEGQPMLNHALGLALIRQRRHADAMPLLRAASEGAPENPRFAFVYGVALHDTGQAAAGIRVLTAAANRHIGDPMILDALVSYSIEAGDRASAIKWAERLVAAMPGNAAAARRLEALRR